MVTSPLGLGLACVLLAIATFGAHGATALLLYSPTKLGRRLAGLGSATQAIEARIATLKAQARELQVIARLLTFVGVVGAVFLTHRSVDGTLGVVALATMALALLFLVGVLPAAIAARRAEDLIVHVAPVLQALTRLLRYPLVLPMLWVAKPVLRALKVPDKPPTDPEEVADEILAAVADSATASALEEERKVWIGNIIELKDLHVSEVMTPRTDVLAFEVGLAMREAVARAVQAGHSRFPVYADKMDNVVGVFYAKDALAYFGQNGTAEGAQVKDIMRQPLFAPESMGVLDLLREFKAQKVQLAVVLDEYGGTAGLITIEDILEEIVGDISDEYDTDEEEPIKVIEDQRVIEVSGKARVEEANTMLEHRVPEGDDYDTVAGFVFNHLGRIPEVGTKFETDGIKYEVLRANGRRIGRLRLTLMQPQPQDN
jgi:magnesium and cobalt exporter, CNNM family